MNVNELRGPLNIRIRLDVPESEKHKCKSPSVHGEHFGYDGAKGTVLALAGNGGAWVCFGETIYKYVGCPLEWLTPMPNVNYARHQPKERT